MILNFCPRCGAALTKHDETVYECDAGHPYYNNPHCGTSMVFLRDGRLLAVRRGIEPLRGKYCLPGGWLEHDEQPADGAQREALEETGVRVTQSELIAAITMDYEDDLTAVSLIFHAMSWEGDFHADDDAAGLHWVDIEAINGPDFSWHYPGLAAKLRTIAGQDNTRQP